MKKFISDREVPNNPFLESSSKETSILDIGVDYLNSVTSRKAPRESVQYSTCCQMGQWDYPTVVDHNINLRG